MGLAGLSRELVERIHSKFNGRSMICRLAFCSTILSEYWLTVVWAEQNRPLHTWVSEHDAKLRLYSSGDEYLHSVLCRQANTVDVASYDRWQPLSEFPHQDVVSTSFGFCNGSSVVSPSITTASIRAVWEQSIRFWRLNARNAVGNDESRYLRCNGLVLSRSSAGIPEDLRLLG